jgi:predicted NUDIX family NTP pyrophosphohydrolase
MGGKLRALVRHGPEFVVIYLHHCLSIFAAVFLFYAGAAARQAAAADSLQVIDNPGGGQVVYGTIDGRHTPQSAMGFMLKQVHGHFGSRPQVSNIFQIRNTTSYGAFFTLIAKNQGGQAIAGEVIVSMPSGCQPAAAILTDDAGHFTRSQPVLLKKLSDAWHISSAAAPTASADGPASPGTIPPLHRVTAGDRSVYISLPDGWQLLNVAGGSVTAQGPRGEKLGLALMIQGIRDPRIRDQFAASRGPSAGAIVYPYGGDLFTAYTSIVNQVRRNQQLPAATFHLTKTAPVAGGAIEAHFDVDLHDGFGERTATARIDELAPVGATWAMGISGSSLPKTVAAAEKDTLLAIIRSTSQDARVIHSEQQAVLGGIRQAGIRAKQQAQQADERRVASAKAFDASMDNIDRQSKAMQNYTLDRSQIQDNELNGRATVSNGLADALIHTDPTRFQVVPPSQFLRGVDY